jgi:DNA-binding MarR family transcriptional regulator
MAVELENMVADIADNSRRIDRLEQDGAARRAFGAHGS